MYKHYIKRPLDILLSLLAMIVLSPILLLVSLLVLIKMGRPILFKQARPGLNEHIFTIYKFRTMNQAKDDHQQLLPDSQRLTKFGRFLRSTSLDELPELFNIIKGDMSIVGPRPLLVEYLPHYTEREKLRHTIRPGLTGLAQVNGRNGLSWEKKFEIDVEYVETISFINDLSIIFKTVFSVFTRKNINSDKSITMEPFSRTN
jgi:undecaprenyl phosphate N,N'-diacetylbacillosamine 1-phosphate transferase